MHHFVTEMCTYVHISVTKCCIVGFTYVHISVTKWCIVGYGTGALWDLCHGFIDAWWYIVSWVFIIVGSGRQVTWWCLGHQPTSHYMNQCWPSSIIPYGVLKTSVSWHQNLALWCHIYYEWLTFGVEVGIILDHMGNSRAADDLVPYVARLSTATLLTMWIRDIPVFLSSQSQHPVTFQCLGIKENTNTLCCLT